MNLCSTPPVCLSCCKLSLHAGLITRPLCEVKSRNETEREKEREMFGERHQVYGFSGDMHKYKHYIYLCANDLQRNGH